MTTITTGAPMECSLAVLSTRLGQQDEQSAKDRCQIDELSQQLSDTTTQLAHISKVLGCLLTGHTPMATLADIPAAPSTSAGNGTVPLGQHHLSHNKALPPVRSIPLPAVSTPMGRQPHTAMQRFGRIKQVLPRHRPTTAQSHSQVILPLRFLDLVSSKPGHCPCPKPTSSPESATTPTGYNHHETVRDPTAQHLGWPPLQQHQTGSGYPSGHGVSAGHLTDNYQCNQHGHGHSHHGQSDPQCASEATAENHTR